MSDANPLPLMTQAEYARHRNVSRQYINKIVAAGHIPTTPEGLIDAAVADSLLHDLAASERGPDDAAQAGTALSQAQLRLVEANATLAEMKLRERGGELVERAAVEQSVANIFAALRDKLLVLPARVAGQVVSLKTEREVAVLLADKLEDELAAFAETLRRDFAQPGDDDAIQDAPGQRDANSDAGHCSSADAAATPDAERVG